MNDLHSHTYYSDGRFSPAEVVEAAARQGLRVLAITDHDNARGAREALPLALQAGIELLAGIEMTTRWPGAGLPPGDTDVDVLGYGINLDDPHLQAFESAMLNDLHARVGDVCKRLAGEGIDISLSDVFYHNPRYAGMLQLIQALLRKSQVSSWDEGLDMAGQAWYAGRQTPFTIAAAIEQIHLAGGIAVLAHPAIVRPGGLPLTARHLAELVDWGLDGIEVYHSRNAPAFQEELLALAEQFHLLVTGGSDMHGWHSGLNELGRQPVTDDMVERIKNAFANGKR